MCSPPKIFKLRIMYFQIRAVPDGHIVAEHGNSLKWDAGHWHGGAQGGERPGS